MREMLEDTLLVLKVKQNVWAGGRESVLERECVACIL